MRRLLLALAVSLLPSLALAHGHGGGGHGGGGHIGGHMGGGWGGHVGHASAAFAGGRMGGWAGHTAGFSHGAFHHGRFAHRHHRFFFAGGPWIGGYGYYGNDCWRWVSTPWGARRIWVCDYY